VKSIAGTERNLNLCKLLMAETSNSGSEEHNLEDYVLLLGDKKTILVKSWKSIQKIKENNTADLKEMTTRHQKSKIRTKSI
jgi:uncharacterized protein YbcV (DUF1398 family)